MLAIGALLRLLASVPEVRRTDIGLSTDPMRSITDSSTVDRSSGGVRPCCPSLLRSPPIEEIRRPVVIEARSLTKKFGDKVAVDDHSFTARPGVVTGFLGPNGAGSRR